MAAINKTAAWLYFVVYSVIREVHSATKKHYSVREVTGTAMIHEQQMASLMLSLPSRYKYKRSIARLSGRSNGSGTSLSFSFSTTSLFSHNTKFLHNIDVNVSHIKQIDVVV